MVLMLCWALHVNYHIWNLAVTYKHIPKLVLPRLLPASLANIKAFSTPRLHSKLMWTCLGQGPPKRTQDVDNNRLSIIKLAIHQCIGRSLQSETIDFFMKKESRHSCYKASMHKRMIIWLMPPHQHFNLVATNFDKLLGRGFWCRLSSD